MWRIGHVDLFFRVLAESKEILGFCSYSLCINIVFYCIEEPNIDSGVDQFCNLGLVVSPKFCYADLLNLRIFLNVVSLL